MSPGSVVVGFPPGGVTEGVVHPGDALALQAQADVTTAHNDAAGRASTATVTEDLGARYSWPACTPGASSAAQAS